ncbi:MAG: hypothetical protein K2X93_18220 [Candidatus Obscuribacterales bacterium]|nr:hypothetical protein [Candidatus Obscuribacterales bacterium]
MNKIKFFLSADPTYAREVIPAVLQNNFHRFKPWGAFHQGDEKFIYIPASDDFPTAHRIRIRENIGHTGEEITLFSERPVKKGSKATKPDSSEIDQLVLDVLLGQARAQLRRKIMPAYRRWYDNFQGLYCGRALFVECESLTECPKGMTGSYITMQTDGKPAESIAWMKRQLVAYVGTRQVDEVTEDFDAMLRRIEASFPWNRSGK